MRNLFLTICVCLMVNMSGCATAGSGSCSSSGFSLFQGSTAVRNQPVRDCIRNWFRGDECDTCNPPVGMPTNYGTNVAPLCDSYGTTGYSQSQPIYSSAPIQQQPIGQGVPLYQDPNLNIGIPTNAAPDYSSNLIDPLNQGINNLDQGINLGTPTGSIEAGYGEIPMGPSF